MRHHLRQSLMLLLISLLLARSPIAIHAGDGVVNPGSPPSVTVSWEHPKQARVEWNGSGSLYRVPVLNGIDGDPVWLGIGNTGALRLGPGMTCDQDKAPAAGDRYELRDLSIGQVIASASLGPEPAWYTTALPAIVAPGGMTIQCV